MNSRSGVRDAATRGLPELNEAQARVASAPGRELFVVAAAGSGKTSALAARYANAVAGRGSRAADAAVAITFTEKAAGELAERIRAVLVARGDEEAARSLDRGWVSTIHGLCARIVRHWALDLGIDPLSTIVSDVDEGELLHACFEHVATELAEADADVDALLTAFGAGDVRQAAIAGLAHLRAAGAAVSEVSGEPVPDPGSVAAQAVAAWRDLAARFAALPDGTSTVRANETACREAAAFLESLDVMDRDWSEAARVTARSLRVRAVGSEAVKDFAASAREVGAWLDRQACDILQAPHRAAFLRLLGALAARYEVHKRERGLLDFADLLSLTLELFRRRPEVAQRYSRRFHAVMIDEYQDTDPVQAAIVGQLAGASLCTVGDAHQAIYGFRFADLSVFRDRRAAVGEARVESLAVNYRSHQEIVEFVNLTYRSSTFFGSDFLPLVAGRTDDGPDWARRISRVRVAVIEPGSCDFSTRDAEAGLVARAILESLNLGAMPGDVSILLRALTHADAYVEALRELDVPVSIESRGPPTISHEARAIVDVLSVVANCHDEFALRSVLAGVVGGLSDSGLLRLWNTARQGGMPVWDALEVCESLGSEDSTRARRVRDLLERLRAVRGRRPLDALVMSAIEDTGLGTALTAKGPEGELVSAGLLRLVSFAAEFQRDVSSDISEFVAHLAARERYAREPTLADLTGDESSVRIMSIHAAKGLEFPFVIVPECGRMPRSETSPILMGRNAARLQIGVKAPAIPDRGLPRGETTSWARIRADLRAAGESEEKRLLYVASTRARDALLISGTPGPNTPISWIMEAATDDREHVMFIPAA